MGLNVVYARKSTDSEDRQVASIDSQVQELRRLAERRGFVISEVLTESQSAKAPGRPVFNALMKRVLCGEISGVLAWKMDRLARNHLDTGIVLQALADGKLERVLTIDREYTEDGNDRFMGNFELGMATKYIDDLRQNVRRGNRARFERGWINHKPPLGYLWEPVTKTVVVDPQRFDLVRRMWDLMLSATMRPSQIRTIATRDWGFRTRRFKRVGGGPLAASTIYAIFANPFYMGLIHLRTGETYRGAHPPMVSPEEFHRVQELLHQSSRPRPQKHEFTYSGLFSCSTCGCRITAEQHVKPSGKTYVYYRCTHKSLKVVCRERALPEPELEQQILHVLSRLTMPEKIQAMLEKLTHRQIDQEQTIQVRAKESLEARLAGLIRERAALLDIRLREHITDELFLAKKQELDREELQLTHRLKEAREDNGKAALLTDRTLSLAQQAVLAFRDGDAVRKRGILLAVGLNLRIGSKKALMELKKPFEMISQAAAISNWWTCANDIRTWILESGEYFTLPDEAFPEELRLKYQNQRKRQGG